MDGPPIFKRVMSRRTRTGRHFTTHDRQNRRGNPLGVRADDGAAVAVAYAVARPRHAARWTGASRVHRSRGAGAAVVAWQAAGESARARGHHGPARAEGRGL